MKKKVLIGLSGGIDSSISAYLLQKDGYEVIGVYMKLHNLIEDYHTNNIDAVKKVATHLNISYHILDIEDIFKNKVYDYFVDGYVDGRTPNPCVRCNREIKFGALVDFADKLKVDFLATGHYAKTDGNFVYKADDSSKDQSYFLGQVKKEVLKKLIFPVSMYQKQDILTLADTMPIFKPIALKKESQEICFVEGVYTDILKKHIDIDKKGDVLDELGNIVGHHKGYMHYTIGKRRGFYVHGAHEPHYVKELDKKTNTIVVCQKDALEINKVEVDKLNMFIDDLDFVADVKLRYRSGAIKSNIKIKNDKATLLLDSPAFGVACGQVAVFYDSDKILGSGYITKIFKN